MQIFRTISLGADLFGLLFLVFGVSQRIPAGLQGKLRTIGVSNFGIAHLDKLMKTARMKPAVNQVELSPFLQRRELVSYCQQQGIALEVSLCLSLPLLLHLWH